MSCQARRDGSRLGVFANPARAVGNFRDYRRGEDKDSGHKTLSPNRPRCKVPFVGLLTARRRSRQLVQAHCRKIAETRAIKPRIDINAATTPASDTGTRPPALRRSLRSDQCCAAAPINTSRPIAIRKIAKRRGVMRPGLIGRSERK